MSGRDRPGEAPSSAARREVARLLLDEFVSDEVESARDLSDLDLMEVLDSIRVLRLCTALEERFGIEIADEEITVENLESVESVANLVDRKRNG